MKFIISENQNEKIAKTLESFLNDYFHDLDSLCNIKVFISEEDDEYDIHIILKKSYVERFNNLGQNNIRVTMKNKVNIAIQKYMLKIKYFISIYTDNC